MSKKLLQKLLPYFLILSSYFFGIICIKWGFYPELVELTWFQMLLTAGILIYVDFQHNTRGFYSFLALSYAVGFLIEVAGVNTGVIFGEYSYGEVLGWKTWGTPWMIGVNWFIVTYIVNQWVSDWKLTGVFHAIVAALIVTGLDYIIEPNAIQLNMWNWVGDSIPLKNYIAWFVISFGLSYYYYKQNLPVKRISKVVLWAMILFFVL